MGFTLNKIAARLRSLALSHKQVNSFYFGDPWEFDINGEITYPACFVEQQPGTIDRTERLQRFNFRVYFLGLVTVSTDTEGNETEVLSDMSSVAADFLAMVMSTVYQDDWLVSPVNNVTSVTEVLGDMAAGVFVDVSIGVDFLADRCQVPSDDVVFDDDGGGLVVINTANKPRVYTYTGTGSEGNSFTVSGIVGKFVLTAFRAGYYKRITTDAPTDYEMIQVAGVQGNGGIDATGTVTLQANDILITGEKLDFLYYGT